MREEQIQIPVTSALARKAHVALDRVLFQPCELLELWEESEDYQLWRDSITELRAAMHT